MNDTLAGPQHNTAAVPPPPKPYRRGPRPSAETIRKRVTFLIGSGNVRELDEAGYVVVPKDMISDLSSMMVTAPGPVSQEGEVDHEG